MEANNGRPKRRGRAMRGMRGYTVIEMVITLAISMIMTSITVPSVTGAINSFNLKSAASAASWAISSTRYQSIMNGYPYEISFIPATFSYQLLSKPNGAGAFSNVGGAVTLVNNSKPVISQATTLQFLPNGTVSATVGTMSFTLTSGNLVETITATGSGSVKVSP